VSRCFALAIVWLLLGAGTIAGQVPRSDEALGTRDEAPSAHQIPLLRAAAVMDPRLQSPLRPLEPGRTAGACSPSSQSGGCDARLATLAGGAAGVGAALLYCSYDDCDVAVFVYALLGGYVGGKLGKLIHCGPGAFRASSPGLAVDSSYGLSRSVQE
jgi:hypothetical protein